MALVNKKQDYSKNSESVATVGEFVGLVNFKIVKVNPTREWLKENNYMVDSNFEDSYNVIKDDVAVGKNIKFCLERNKEIFPFEQELLNEIKRKQETKTKLNKNEEYFIKYIELAKNVQIKKVITFELKPELSLTKDGYKTQKIDIQGNTKWVTAADLENPDTFKYMKPEGLRTALKGESNLIDFFLAVTSSGIGEKDYECSLESITKIVNNSVNKSITISDLESVVKELREFIESKKEVKYVGGLLIRAPKKDSDISYREIYNKRFLPHGFVASPYAPGAFTNFTLGIRKLITTIFLGGDYNALKSFLGFNRSTTLKYFFDKNSNIKEITKKNSLPEGAAEIIVKAFSLEDMFLQAFDPEKGTETIEKTDSSSVIHNTSANNDFTSPVTTTAWGELNVEDNLTA